MTTRILILMFIVALAIPVTALTRPGETSPAPWSDAAVAAKGKKHKNRVKQRKPGTVIRTIRQPVTQTFASTTPITIPAAPGMTNGQASPYPAVITVNGFANGTITDVNLILSDFTNSYVADVGVLLSHDNGRRALVMTNVANGYSATDVDLTLDDEAAAPLSQMALTSGTFRPADLGGGLATFNAPAPAPNGAVALSIFDGADPNGTWRLWVMEAAPTDDSGIGGWSLQITADADVQVQQQVKETKHMKQGKRRH